MRGERGIGEGSEVGERCARVYACRVCGGTEHTRSYKAVGSVISGSVWVVGGGVDERATGESEGEGVCSWTGGEPGLRVKRLKTIV